MRLLDRLHLEFPFAGSRMLRGLLAAGGCKIGRRHVKTLMWRMAIEALYPRPRPTKPEPDHKIYPYLLRGIEITRPNQVWAMNITYIPMARGFVYLAVVLNWATRRVLSWRLSITTRRAFALARHGKPEIFNTDEGSQFTGAAFTGVLADNGIAIRTDGKGAWRDNVFVERLWRSLRYEEVYLRAYDSVSEARASIGRYLDFYNGRRPHSSLAAVPRSSLRQPAANPHGGLTPADAPLIGAEILFKQPRPAQCRPPAQGTHGHNHRRQSGSGSGGRRSADPTQLVRHHRNQHRRPVPDRPLAATTAARRQLLFPIEPEELFVVDQIRLSRTCVRR